MSYLFIKELKEDTPILEFISMDDIDDAMNNFRAYAERKLKGYSVREIDILANKAKNVNSEVSKRETLSRIEAAIKDAQAELQKTNDEEKKKELRLQIQTLGELKNKVNSFNVVDDKKPSEDKNKRVINLDDD